MSRVGRKPIAVPANVNIEFQNQHVNVEGPKGRLEVAVPQGVSFKLVQNQLTAEREAESYAPVHGLARSLVANAVKGVSAGFQKELDVVGVGYRAEMKGKTILVLSLGYSHLIEYRLPPGIEIAVDAKLTHITVTGIDRQRVGQVAAELRSLRPPDPYKNKGVRYTNERLKKKEGKTGAK